MKYTDNTYNGWTNWETWNFMLWVNNNEKLYNIVTDAIDDMVNEKYQINWLKIVAKEIAEHPELCPDIKKSDIKNINYVEILEVLLEDK
tara:strand:- start:517 stop:783 length:267 start_codon:yes stop_codon:yes gene_type:complete